MFGKGRLLVITGLDGSGITTVSKKLSELLPDSLLIETPQEPFRSFRSIVDSLPSVEAKYFFYMSANAYASRVASIAMNDGRDVIMGRYLIDTVVSNRVAGLNVSLEYRTSAFDLVRPDYTFFLKVREDTRIQRIEGRGYPESDLDLKLRDVEIRRRFLEEFDKLRSEFILIDNEGELGDTCRKILEMIS